MGTRRNGPVPPHSSPSRGSGSSVDRGLIAIAVLALIGVGAAAIFALLGDGSSVGSVSPARAAASSTTGEFRDSFGWTVFLWDPDTGHLRALHRADVRLDDAELSPDGRRIVYASRGLDGSSQIYLLDAGGAERRLTDLKGGAFEPTWSPDGRRIAFSGSRHVGSDNDIYVMDADGGRVRRLLQTPRDDGHPDWSPDGSQIAFHARYEDHGIPGSRIWVGSVHARTLTSVTSTRVPFGAADPAWSPQGRWLAFSRFDRRVSKAALWLMRPDGSHLHRIGRPDSAHKVLEDPTWSPDGRSLAFERSSGLEVGLIDTRSGRIHGLFHGAGATGPSWSADGILLTLPDGATVASPGAAPPRFTVQLAGLDATVIATGGRCELRGVHGPIRPGRLTLQFVDHSRRDGMFTLVRMIRGVTIADLRADPGAVMMPTHHRGRIFVAAGATKAWTSAHDIAGGRWAVACWKDVIPAPNGIRMMPVGIASFDVDRRAEGAKR